MIYNTKLGKRQTNVQCLECPHFQPKCENHPLKVCKGLGKRCFEQDPITGSLLDPITKQVVDIKKLKKEEI